MSSRTEPRQFARAVGMFEHALQRILRSFDDSEGDWHIAVAGGNTPRELYRRLAHQKLDGSRVHVWWGDERCVPRDHIQSNFRMVHECWLHSLPGVTMHPILGELSPRIAAQRYAKELQSAPALDIALLGLGADAHTASLFPGRPEALDEEAYAVAALAPSEPVDRVSMGLRVLAAARQRIFLVNGADKHAAVRRVLVHEEGLAASRLVDGAEFLLSPPLGSG